jgi:beta-phosphoglucomutase
VINELEPCTPFVSLTAAVPDGRPRGVLFDCDGVLVDSEPALARIAALALRDFGLPAEAEDFAPFIGMGEVAYIGGAALKHGGAYSDQMKEHIYEKYIEGCEGFVLPMPGALELLRTLRGAGFRIALATSADRVKAAANLRVLGMDESFFDAVVTGSDVARKKPYPDIYLLAASRCGVAPEDAYVVEDAESGIQSACAAGMHAVGLSSSLPAGRLFAAGAREVIDRLDMLPAIVGI